MREELVQAVAASLKEARSLYHRLVLLVGPSASGKTACLRQLAEREGLPMVNMGVELSRRLLPLTERQRVLQTPRLMEDLLATSGNDTVILDNPEVVFSPALQQDPLRLLAALSRNRSIAAAWPGRVAGNWIDYAEHGHPEYRRYVIKDYLVVDATADNSCLEERT